MARKRPTSGPGKGGRDEQNRRRRRYPRGQRVMHDGNRGSKYGASKVTEDGHVFDSRKEHSRYCELKILQRAGMITDLEVHPSWTFQHPDGRWLVIRSQGFPNGRRVKYSADF